MRDLLKVCLDKAQSAQLLNEVPELEVITQQEFDKIPLSIRMLPGWHEFPMLGGVPLVIRGVN